MACSVFEVGIEIRVGGEEEKGDRRESRRKEMGGKGGEGRREKFGGGGEGKTKKFGGGGGERRRARQWEGVVGW